MLIVRVRREAGKFFDNRRVRGEFDSYSFIFSYKKTVAIGIGSSRSFKSLEGVFFTWKSNGGLVNHPGLPYCFLPNSFSFRISHRQFTSGHILIEESKLTTDEIVPRQFVRLLNIFDAMDTNTINRASPNLKSSIFIKSASANG